MKTVSLPRALDLPRRGWTALPPSVRIALTHSALFLTWCWWVQSFANRRALLVDATCYLVAYGLVRWVAKKRRQPRARPALVALTAWLLISLLDPLRERALPRQPERFAASVTRSALADELGAPWPKQRIGLALSGGGFRAAVYHAGVLQQLEELGVRPTNLSVVSGGAIIGSFYAAGGHPRDFAAAVAAGKFNLRRRLALIQNTIRLPFPFTVPVLGRLAPFYEYSRLDTQAEIIHSLLLGDTSTKLCPACPRLLVNATDLRYATLVGMLDEGIVFQRPPGWEELYRDGTTLSWSKPVSLAERVAISGAFPGAFPARRARISIAQGRPVEAQAPRVDRELVLADGGVADNSGIRLLETTSALATVRRGSDLSLDPAYGDAWNIDVFLASNAGALFDVPEELSSLSELTRAVDVIAQLNLTLAITARTMSPALVESRVSRAGLSIPPPPPDQIDSSCTAAKIQMLGRQRLDEGVTIIGPQNGLEAIDRLFTSALDGTGRTQKPNPRFVPAYYPTPILRAIAALLPGAAAAEAGQVVERLDKSREELLAGDDPGRTIRQAAMASRDLDSSPRPCSDRGSAEERLACATSQLRVAVRREFERTIAIFASTSTLDDQLGDERVEALFRLGQTEVLIAWPILRRALLHEDTAGRLQGDIVVQGLTVPIVPLSGPPPRPQPPGGREMSRPNRQD